MGQLIGTIRVHFRETITTSTYHDFETEPVDPGKTHYIDAVTAELDTDAPSEVRLGIRTAGFIFWLAAHRNPVAGELSVFKAEINLREAETLVIRIYASTSAKEANAYVLGKVFRT